MADVPDPHAHLAAIRSRIDRISARCAAGRSKARAPEGTNVAPMTTPLNERRPKRPDPATTTPRPQPLPPGVISDDELAYLLDRRMIERMPRDWGEPEV